MQQKRKGIALLITLMFVIVITISIGFTLTQVNNATKMVREEKSIYQNSIIIEDILQILKTSTDIQTVADSNSSEDLFTLISEASFIPFSSNNLDIVMKIQSARSRFNPNTLNKNRDAIFQKYLSKYAVNTQYVAILHDCMGGVKEDNSYNSSIFDTHPYLFRDYIASTKHLKKINDFYTNEFNDNSLKNINFNNLFYLSADKNVSIDLNYATGEVWQMILGCPKKRADFLVAGEGNYKKVADLELTKQEKEHLALFKTSYYEPILLIKLKVKESNINSNISFEYNIKTKKGSHFVYEI